jgi:UDP-N-acetylglucosamine--N-acetylmuramyl-(pentapeptide) pyrophosphoryl-undecaprenol N-acetylglucosamine transferase
MKILITGGHLTPALALIDYIQVHHPQDKVLYVGRKFAQEKLQQESLEREEIAKRKNVQFRYFTAPKLHFDHYWTLPVQIWQMSRAVPEAKKILHAFEPQIVVSFGGYLALPFAWAAYRSKVPVVTHEQTRTAGLANKIIAQFARKVAVSFAETLPNFPARKTILTGNLLRPEFHHAPSKAPVWFKNEDDLPILYLTGGSQGSFALNQVVKKLLPQLLEKWCVIHQVGKKSLHLNPRQELQTAAEQLGPQLQKRYFIREWLTEVELRWLYQHVSLAAGRAGANTVMELSVHQVPALFIPLPASHGNEQLKNAESMSQVGAAQILSQDHLTPENFLSALNEVQQHRTEMKDAAKNLLSLYPQDSVKRFYQLLYESV